MYNIIFYNIQKIRLGGKYLFLRISPFVFPKCNSGAQIILVVVADRTRNALNSRPEDNFYTIWMHFLHWLVRRKKSAQSAREIIRCAIKSPVPPVCNCSLAAVHKKRKNVCSDLSYVTFCFTGWSAGGACLLSEGPLLVLSLLVPLRS